MKKTNITIGIFAAISLGVAIFVGFGGQIAEATNNILKPKAVYISPTEAAASDVDPQATASVSTVVNKALALKALLTTAQQATLQQTYTTSLARKWSNLPCGSSCRNGVQFSSLTADQRTAALDLIQSATGTAANEGYQEILQLRNAEEYLQANGGGSGYDENIWFVAFLNQPSTTGAWMLQFGAHHYAANIAFNNGHVVGATPRMEGVEPTTFTYNSVSYSPLTQEHDAMTAMLASMTTAQLTSAKITNTYSDVTMSPGETNGGNGTFPTTRVGVKASTLSTTTQAYILAAMKPWVNDMDDASAAGILRIYQNEIADTYVAYTGNGTSGTASTFLNAHTNYVRLDGPSVWIEFICQNGAVFPSQIHYHSVWRDRQRDYGGDLALTVPLDNAGTANNDFDGDGKTDISVFRPSTGVWYLNRTTSGFAAYQFGSSSDTVVPSDYDGDGKTDVAVYRPSSGIWYVLSSSASTVSSAQFGISTDIPIPADYDGDGKSDIAVYRPNSQGTFYVQQTTSGFKAVNFGLAEDKPTIGDFDGDGKADFAVFRPSSGDWYRLNSSDSGFVSVHFGASGDKVVPEDYDGDGKTDYAVYRPSAGVWYILPTGTMTFYAMQFGLSTDTPIPGDYDGDGKADIAVYRPGSSSSFYLQQSTSGFASTAFGITEDTPTASYLVH